MMQTLRQWIRFGFGCQALVMFVGTLSLFSTLAMMNRLEADSELPPGTLGMVIAFSLIGPVLGIVPAMAWWAIKKGKPSARGWVITASILNLFLLALGILSWFRMEHMRTWPFYALCGVMGILGPIAFWRYESAPSIPKSVRVAGDGTSKLKDWGAQVISVGVIWLAFGWWSRWATSHGLSFPSIVPFIVQMELAVLLTTLGHELGHLEAGWASGKILRIFHVGPFRWAVRNGVWKFDFNLLKLYGGSVGMVAPDLKNMRSRKAFSLIGGPVASLVMGSIFTVVTLLTPGGPWQQYWLFFSMLATFSISAFIVNLIPLKPESAYSDGAQLYQIISNGPWARVHFAFAMVSTSMVSAVRPRDFDVTAIHRAADVVPTGERGLLLRLFACLHYLDTDQIPEALASMEEAEALYEGSRFEKPQDICAEFAFMNALYKRDLATAEAWWKRIEALKKIDTDADYWRARTALLWLRGDREQALGAWEQGHALAQKLPAAGAYDCTRALYAKLRAALDEPVATTPPPLESLEALAEACEFAQPQVAFEI
jgi:hypothetical protein